MSKTDNIALAAELETVERDLSNGFPMTCERGRVMQEAVAALATILAAEAAAREEAAQIAQDMPVQIYRDEGIGAAGRSCKPATFDDVADAIRALNTDAHTSALSKMMIKAREDWLPDEIDLYRIIKKSGARKRIDIARAILAALKGNTP